MFQSTPPVAGGRCAYGTGAHPDGTVSIHAPRCRGTMPERKPVDVVTVAVSIHAPRCRGTMRSFKARSTSTRQFQSTPPVAGGRCLVRNDPLRVVMDGFNPRPPLPGDDAICEARLWFSLAVSIHAPRCRGTMQPSSPARSPASPFQSTPPVAGGRCSRPRSGLGRTYGFQSTPPVAGGRCQGD